MPFGLRNVPTVFQRAINQAPGKLTNTFALTYLDDVIISSRTVAEGIDRLRIVLSPLSSAGFTLNQRKCFVFFKNSVQYLGYLASSGDIRSNPAKIQVLTALPHPTTVTQVRQFVDLASYFRQFIPTFNNIAAPLYQLTTGKGNIEWKSHHKKVRP